jgi:predicted hydrocarbon binding protein
LTEKSTPARPITKHEKDRRTRIARIGGSNDPFIRGIRVLKPIFEGKTAMNIRNKPEPDPAADLYLVDAYMRWALLAAEEVAGERGLSIVLREAGLERFIDNYPPDELKISRELTFGDYANLNAGLLNFFGRAAKSMALRIGRLSAQQAIEQQSALFGLAALVTSKVLPVPSQLKLGMENMQSGFRKLSQSVGQDYHLSIEDRGHKLAYIAADCPFCAGKEASGPICWIWVGTLQESVRWLIGREFEIEEVECRATGAPACVWEVSKRPKA